MSSLFQFISITRVVLFVDPILIYFRTSDKIPISFDHTKHYQYFGPFMWFYFGICSDTCTTIRNKLNLMQENVVKLYSWYQGKVELKNWNSKKNMKEWKGITTRKSWRKIRVKPDSPLPDYVHSSLGRALCIRSAIHVTVRSLKCKTMHSCSAVPQRMKRQTSREYPWLLFQEREYKRDESRMRSHSTGGTLSIWKAEAARRTEFERLYSQRQIAENGWKIFDS